MGRGMLLKKLKSVTPKRTLGYLSQIVYPPYKSYSGGGEDAVIEYYFKKNKVSRGFYVDVGCFHPKVASNTHNLYRKGWSGINIDVDQYKIDVFNTFRPRDRNLCVAISDQEGEADIFFHVGESYGSMTGLDREGAERRARNMGRQVQSRKVRTRPLSAILREEGVTKIDLLSVDVEGAEEEVLSTLDFGAIDIGLMAIEIHGDYDAVNKSRVCSLLRAHDYEITAWTPPTVFFRKP